MIKQAIGSVVVIMLIGGCAASSGDGDGDEEEQNQQTSELNGSGLSARVWRTGGSGLRVRAEPNTTSAIVGSLSEGQSVRVTCQITGEMRDGTSVWDYIESAGGYVSDAYLYTGHDGFAPGVSRCSSGSGSGSGSSSSSSGGSSGGSSSSSSEAAAQKAIAEARKHLGYRSNGTCNFFSAYWNRSGGCQAWCSDFVDYVWMKAGFDVDGITGYSGTIYEYGLKHGTVKGRYATNVKPGDAVLWGAVGGYSAHVGMVTAVNGSNITVIHGNYASSVFEGPLSSREDTVGTGYGIYAFVSPVQK